ncbi:MAG: C4-dicarboxylate transporter DcuC [Spirochaetes bacterium]|nr:C4-dicarboxylate transporter DcuC [Spirochaetota bacterium]
MFYIGLVIVALAIFAIVKRFEVRLILFVSGLLMCLVAGNPLGAISAFTAGMIHGTLVPIICSVMGFAYVLKLTQCDAHLVHALTKPMTKLSKGLVPGAVIVTFLINTALTSAAGVSAAVGAILIPALMAAGVHPGLAAAAVMAGTFGSTLNPGNAHVVMVAGFAGVSPVDVAISIAPRSVVSALIGAVSITIIAFVTKEYKGYVPENAEEVAAAGAEFKVNPLKAIVPAAPLALLVLSSSTVGLFETEVTVPQAMIAGIFLAGLVSWKNAQEVSKAFFSGMGQAYADVIGIIAAAGVFTTGMAQIGLTSALIGAMEQSDAIVRVASTFGPMIIAILAGTGDAATLAFNNAITPYAAQFGLDMIHLGNTANIAGALGRTMSPLAPAAIICASLAKVNPIEITKRNGPGMFLAAIFIMLTL